jgi:HK97 family phage portal protein
MNIRLPIIGNVKTGKDIPVVDAITIPKKVKNALLGTFLDMGDSKLSDDKSVSSKLLNAFYEWVYINVTTLGEEISKLEPELYKVVLKGGKYELVEIETHPLLDLLDAFNPTTTQSDGFYLTEAHLDLTGDSIWYLENGASGLPTAIYLLRPDQVELKLASDGSVLAYVEKKTVNGKTIETTYEPEEILHIKVPNPMNQYRGASVVEGIAASLDIDTNILEASKSFYLNGMMTQFMLTTDSKLTQDQLKKLKTELRAAYAGSKNFWKVPIFGGGIKPETVQMSSRDAQQIDQQAWLRDKIMAAFKNTKISLGIVEDVNKASGESSLLNWKQSTIKPKMCRIVDALNEYLVPRYGDNLVLGFKDPVPEDMTRKVTDATALYGAGIITQDEARELVDFDALTGDQKQTYTEDTPPKALQSINMKKIYRRKALMQMKKDWNAAYEAAKPVAKKIMTKEIVEVKQVERIHPKFTNDQIWTFWEKQIHMVEVTEKRFHNMLTQFIDDIVEEGIHNVDNPEARKSRNLINNDRWEANAVAKFTPILTEIAVASGNHAYNLLGIDHPYIPKAMKTFDLRASVEDRIKLFAGSMIQTDEDTMVDIIVSGLQEGSSIPSIKSAIREKFATYTSTQAERVTRTEVLTASNNGIEDAYIQSGVVEAKEWLTAGDPCPLCEEYSGKVVELTCDFYTGDTEFDDGNPPLHPNCRCTIIPVLTSAKAFDGKSLTQIKTLESKIDKRTKEYKKLSKEKLESDKYIKELEKLAGL